MKKKETKKVSFDCPVDLLEKIDTLAEYGDLTRQKLITNLLEVEADTLLKCKKVGVLAFTLLVRDMKEDMSKWAKKIREKTSLNGFSITK